MEIVSIQEIKQLVIQNRLSEAFEGAAELFQQQKLPAKQKELQLLQSRYEQVKAEKRKNTIRPEDYDRTLAQIREGLLELLDTSESRKLPPVLPKAGKQLYIWILSLLLIAILAWWIFARPLPSNLQLTVFIHGPDGQQDYLLEEEGELILDIKGDRRTAAVGSKGRTVFDEIPRTYAGTSIPVSLRSDRYELDTTARMIQLSASGEKTVVYLQAATKCRFCRVYGEVRNDTTFLSGIKVAISGTDLSDTTDQDGKFEILVPSDMEQDGYTIQLIREGKIVKEVPVTPNQKSGAELFLY